MAHYEAETKQEALKWRTCCNYRFRFRGFPQHCLHLDSQDKTEISLRYVHGLERKITRLQEIIEILQAVDCTAHSPLKEKLEALEALYGKYNVHVFCEALQVPRGTFYNHIFRNKRQNNSYRKRRDELRIQVQRVYDESRQIYGAEKIAAVLKQEGIYTSKEMVWN